MAYAVLHIQAKNKDAPAAPVSCVPVGVAAVHPIRVVRCEIQALADSSGFYFPMVRRELRPVLRQRRFLGPQGSSSS
jgi:hypothetical protein